MLCDLEAWEATDECVAHGAGPGGGDSTDVLRTH